MSASAESNETNLLAILNEFSFTYNSLSAVCPEWIETIICLNACFVNDEGGPLGIGIQVLVSNHLQVLSSKAMVLSVLGKGWLISQVSVMELNVSERLLMCRK